MNRGSPACNGIIPGSHVALNRGLLLSVFFFLTWPFLVPQVPGKLTGVISIGILIQDTSSTAAIKGARIAINQANRKGGTAGLKFELLVRSMEGPWGTGSKQAVDLIFNEKISALVGSHDGRNAHLVEQAATKSQTLFLSAWSGDPTLSQAFVPWFFNLVPNYDQQAMAILDELKGSGKFIVVADNEYDSQMAVKSLIKAANGTEPVRPVNIDPDNLTPDIKKLTALLRNNKPEALLVFCSPVNALKIIREIKAENIKVQIMGPVQIVNEDILSSADLNELDNCLLIPSVISAGSPSQPFITEFTSEFGSKPGPVSSFAFDCITTLTEALRIAGSTERERVQEVLYRIDYHGVTGRIKFDKHGNRMGKLVMKPVSHP